LQVHRANPNDWKFETASQDRVELCDAARPWIQVVPGDAVDQLEASWPGGGRPPRGRDHPSPDGFTIYEEGRSSPAVSERKSSFYCSLAASTFGHPTLVRLRPRGQRATHRSTSSTAAI